MKDGNWISQIFSIKYGALAILVLQNTFLVVFMHYSRTMQGPMYASSTAVASMELLKFLTCLCVVTYQSRGLSGLWQSLNNELFSQPMELLKLSVPSLAYVVQNNLLYYALSNLDAATYQVGYQLKILTTAVFSVVMLGKTLSWIQWGSLIILTVGVSLAQLSTTNSNDAKTNTVSGFVAVILAACTSGFAGVYFEKILKNAGTSLWMRNIQMGVTSLVLAFVGIFLSGDREIVMEHGFFYGYNMVVWVVIFLQAIGGLVVAVVVKYADNILKGFAASFSIVTSCLLSWIAFDFHPNFIFLVGAILVNVSMYTYSYEPSKKDFKRETSSQELSATQGTTPMNINYGGTYKVTSSTTARGHIDKGEIMYRSDQTDENRLQLGINRDDVELGNNSNHPQDD